MAEAPQAGILPPLPLLAAAQQQQHAAWASPREPQPPAQRPEERLPPQQHALALAAVPAQSAGASPRAEPLAARPSSGQGLASHALEEPESGSCSASEAGEEVGAASPWEGQLPLAGQQRLGAQEQPAAGGPASGQPTAEAEPELESPCPYQEVPTAKEQPAAAAQPAAAQSAADAKEQAGALQKQQEQLQLEQQEPGSKAAEAAAAAETEPSPIARSEQQEPAAPSGSAGPTTQEPPAEQRPIRADAAALPVATVLRQHGRLPHAVRLPCGAGSLERGVALQQGGQRPGPAAAVGLGQLLPQQLSPRDPNSYNPALEGLAQRAQQQRRRGGQPQRTHSAGARALVQRSGSASSTHSANSARLLARAASASMAPARDATALAERRRQQQQGRQRGRLRERVSQQEAQRERERTPSPRFVELYGGRVLMKAGKGMAAPPSFQVSARAGGRPVAGEAPPRASSAHVHRSASSSQRAHSHHHGSGGGSSGSSGRARLHASGHSSSRSHGRHGAAEQEEGGCFGVGLPGAVCDARDAAAAGCSGAGRKAGRPALSRYDFCGLRLAFNALASADMQVSRRAFRCQAGAHLAAAAGLARARTTAAVGCTGARWDLKL